MMNTETPGPKAPIWLSLGENCLSDDILKRHGRKSFSSPYAPARTNIDYAIKAEQQDFRGLLEPSHLTRAILGRRTVVRSRTYIGDSGIFAAGVSKGFEFTHHNVLDDPDALASYERKVDRWKEARNSGIPILFLYHYRQSATNDVPLFIERMNLFCRLFCDRGGDCTVVAMHQTLTNDRAFNLRPYSSRVWLAEFHTREEWEGNDQEVVWARKDDDLLSLMFQQVDDKYAAARALPA